MINPKIQNKQEIDKGVRGWKFIKNVLASLAIFGILATSAVGTVAVAASAGGADAPANSPSYNAGSGPCNNNDGKICNPIKANSINVLLASILAIVKFVAGIVLVIYFILAGFRYVTARGDESKIKDATRMLTWTAVGGAILLGAEVIQKLISNTISQLGTGL
jgi:hypothetical protein